MERGQQAELSGLAQHKQQTEVAAEAQKGTKDAWIRSKACQFALVVWVESLKEL